MTKRRLSYDDAIKLLGGQSKWATLLGKAAGAGLASVPVVGPALTFLDLKDEVEQAGQTAITALRNKLTGLSRFKRSELIEAAHAVLVVSAFFAALDDLDAEVNTALNSATLKLTRDEQVALADSSWMPPRQAGLASLIGRLTSPGTIPGLDADFGNLADTLSLFYADMAESLVRFAAGTATWNERDDTTLNRWIAATANLPGRAVAEYEGLLVRLAGDFPEFAFWAHRVGQRALLDRVTGINQTTAELLAATARGTTPSKVRAELAARYNHELSQPVAKAAEPAGAVVLPALRDLYVYPFYGLLDASGQATNGDGKDLWKLVAEHLISTEAVNAPIVLFGQPGAGKSVFTQVLAADLDPRDFLVVRVELRAVPSDAGVQQQVEAALRELTGRTMSWPDLVEDVGDAQPVIVLDGFDELLQASGRSHYDYLERVQEFQDREASLGRPVAVLVTSRTAVAGQVRYPDGTVLIRLEEFDDTQVSRWLTAWNNANPAGPLPVEIALEQEELARQPLLLFMLALFHSGGGALAPGLTRSELYQRLFTEFVERDVGKLGPSESGLKRARQVRRDLDQLSLVAFAMFNRGQESIAGDELNADLAALDRIGHGTDADRLAGRFFFRLFVQRDQAVQGHQTTVSRFEFLHATFGEFLVARWVVAELRALSELDYRSEEDVYRRPLDDDLFRTLLSWEVLSTREQRILDFIAELLTGVEADELARLRRLLDRLFRDCLQPRPASQHGSYQPTRQTAPTTYAAYSANLFLLLLVTAEADGTEPVQFAKLDGETFYSHSGLWCSQLSRYRWLSLLDVIHVHAHAWSPGTGFTNVTSAWFTRWLPVELSGSVRESALFPELLFVDPRPHIFLGDRPGQVVREAILLGSGYHETVRTLLPYLRVIGYRGQGAEFQLGTGASALLTLLISPPWVLPADARATAYGALLAGPSSLRKSRLLLEQLRVDLPRLRLTDLAVLTVAALPMAWTHITAYLDVLAHLHASGHSRLPLDEILKVLELDREVTSDKVQDLLDRLTGRPGNAMAERVSFSFDIDEFRELTMLLQRRDDNEVLFVAPTKVNWLRIMGSLELVTEFSATDVTIWSRRGVVSSRALLDIALWSGLAERGLPVARPYPSIPAYETSAIYDISPEFVGRVRELALSHGYPDPFLPDRGARDETAELRGRGPAAWR